MINKYNKKNVGSENFNSVSEFIKAISSRGENKAFTDSYRLASKDNDFDFTGTQSYEEAQDVLKNGYKEGLENMMNTTSNVKVSNKNMKNERQVYFYGSTPCISNVLTGMPKTMYRRHTETKKVKTIEINYDICISGSCSRETLTLGGKNIISLVKYFENKGMNVKLNVFFAMNLEWSKESKMACMTVKVKDYSQKINPLLVSYTLTHPSFFRRHCFRWVETSELTNYKGFTHGYGYVSNMLYSKEQITSKLRENKVISKEGYYINVTESAGAKDMEDLLKKLGINV